MTTSTDTNTRSLLPPSLRVSLFHNNHSTNTAVIDKAPKTTSTGKKPVVTNPLGAQKFGVQAKKAAVIRLFRNGDKHHAGETFTVNTKTVTSMTQVYEKVNGLVRLPTGAVRKIWKSNLKTTVKDVNDFEDGQHYICTGAEPIDVDRLPLAFSKNVTG